MSAAATQQLTQLAVAAETVLSQGRPPASASQRADLALIALRPMIGTPSPVALGAYCTGLGELVRRGWVDADLSPVTILRTGFEDAQSVHDGAVQARAAFRLSRALADLASDAQSQASRGGDASGPAAVTTADLLSVRSGAAACSAATTASDRDVRGGGDPVAALQCSAALAAASDDPEQAAVANLTLARELVTAASRASANDIAPLRRRATAIASNSLSADTLRQLQDREVAGRLVDAAIDAGDTDAGRLEPAIAWMEMDRADIGSAAYAAALRGRLALAQGDPEAARAALRLAIQLESQRTAPLRLPDWYMLMAQADPQHRRDHVLAAYVALQNVRPLLPLRDPLTGESTFELHMRAVFIAAVDAQLAPSDAGSGGQIAEVQRIVEAYRQAEIESYFGNECAPPRAPIHATQLRRDEVILYPLLLPDRVELIYAAGGEGGGFVRVPPNRNYTQRSVAQLVSDLRTALLMRGEDSADGRKAARALYDLLIAPIAAKLTPETTLVVVPDGPLRLLPFAALVDGQGRFLAQDNQLVVTPALAYSQPGADHLGPNAAIAASALNHQVSFNQIVFPALPGAENEAKAAVGGGGAGRREGVLIADLTEANLEKALAGGHFTVLHLATHASFNASSGRSYIVAEDGLIPLQSLREMIGSVGAHGAQLDLIVLSACETAVGNDEASMGLAGAAIDAGAHSAVASLWRVNDASTAQFMRSFYESYRGGASKAGALRKAQLSLLADPRYRDPYYWAAFTLIGAWR